MRILFHVGLNKAGSTYLQDALAFNCDHLSANRIAYPNAPAMTKNNSSTQSGNGQRIYGALRRRDTSELAFALGELAHEAGRVNTLLISNESVYHQIVDRQAYSMLMDALAALGYDDVHLVVIFRNIYSHAVSAYSHRAGNNPVPDFATWIQPDDRFETHGAFEKNPRKPFIDVYEFWSELPRFVQRLASNDERVRFHLLRQESDILHEFGDLLGLALEAPGKPTSNVSINLVEAELARQLWGLSPPTARAYRRLAKETPRACKASDLRLREAYFDEVEQHLPTIRAELDILTEFFGGYDPVRARPSLAPPSDDRLETPSGLSDDQVAALVKAIQLGERDNRIEALRRLLPRRLASLGKRMLRR